MVERANRTIKAALKQQQSDLTNDTQFNPTSEVKFSEGDMVMVRVFVKQGAFTPDRMAHMKLKLYATAVWPQL